MSPDKDEDDFGDQGPIDNPGSNKVFEDSKKVSEETPSSGHFMAYFVTVIVMVIILYLAYHNKAKVRIHEYTDLGLPSAVTYGYVHANPSLTTTG